jgi:hypothetical protein
MNLKIIDFDDSYGYVLKLFLGKKTEKEYYGDDWNDAPYEHNAGLVYDKYVEQTIEIPIITDCIILYADSGYVNSPYCKLDFKARKVPFLVVSKNIEGKYNLNFNEECKNPNNAVIFFEEDIQDVLKKLDPFIIKNKKIKR